MLSNGPLGLNHGKASGLSAMSTHIHCAAALFVRSFIKTCCVSASRSSNSAAQLKDHSNLWDGAGYKLPAGIGMTSAQQQAPSHSVSNNHKRGSVIRENAAFLSVTTLCRTARPVSSSSYSGSSLPTVITQQKLHRKSPAAEWQAAWQHVARRGQDRMPCIAPAQLARCAEAHSVATCAVYLPWNTFRHPRMRCNSDDSNRPWQKVCLIAAGRQAQRSHRVLQHKLLWLVSEKFVCL